MGDDLLDRLLWHKPDGETQQQLVRYSDVALKCLADAQIEAQLVEAFRASGMPIVLRRFVVLVAMAYTDQFRREIFPHCDPRRFEQFVRLTRDRLSMFMRDEHRFRVRSTGDQPPYYTDYMHVLVDLQLRYRQRFDYEGQFFRHAQK